MCQLFKNCDKVKLERKTAEGIWGLGLELGLE